MKTREICMIGVCTAVIAVMAQISIPMPMGVPMTMQTFAITFVAILLGAKGAGLATLAYVLLGAVGAPVFANFSGGLQNLVGPTGGFLLSFPLMAFVIGLGVRHWNEGRRWLFVVFLLIGTVLNYVVGVAMFCVLMNSSIMTAVAACVLPFIPTAILKAVLATLLGFQLRRRMGVVLCA